VSADSNTVKKLERSPAVIFHTCSANERNKEKANGQEDEKEQQAGVQTAAAGTPY
jgi:hypothetical protein